MPNFGVVGGQKVAWKLSDKPRVFIGSDDVETDWMTCTGIEHTTGGTPTRAFLRIGTTDFTGDGPITLNRFQFPWKPGTKVVIKVGEIVRFRGCMLQRRDTGQADEIVWEAWDDRWLLWQIPIRGCLVHDPEDGSVKFCTGYEPRFNPYGRWNCILADVAGLPNQPVFTHVAEIGKTYEAPNEAFNDTEISGRLCPWTPRRMLQYLRLLTRLSPGDLDGINSQDWRSLANCDRLEWLESANNLIGRDSEQEFDPLDRKLPDMSLRGRRMLGAIEQALRAAGTHGLALEYGESKSFIKFYPRGFSANLDLNYASTDLRILRGGDADDIDTVYDFELVEDATETVESVLVEGARVHVESSFEYSNDYATIEPAWTAEQEQAFIDGIRGDGTFAYYPARDGTTELTEIANSSVDNFAFANTPEAVALLRQFFPEVGRAWAINSTNAADEGILAGVGGAFSDQAEFPVLNIKGRRPLSEQLQFYIGQDGQRLMQKYPIRLQVKRNGEWADIPFGSGQRVDERGWLWIDGLCEEQDGGPFCLYDGKLVGVGVTDTITFRDLRVNCAVRLDHRVKGYEAVALSETSFDVDLYDQLGGPPMQYIDSPESYHEEHQVNSSPTPAGEIPTNDTNGTLTYTPTPLNNYLPPGSERVHAEYAAQRRLFADKWIKRQSRWSYVGIRPDFLLGQWIGSVRVVNPKDDDSDYEISAPIEMMCDDFLGQTTVLGGLLSTISRSAAMQKGGEETDGKQYGDMTPAESDRYKKIQTGEIPSMGGFVGDAAIKSNWDWLSKQ